MTIYKNQLIYLGTTTWANRAVAPQINAEQLFTDIGPNGAKMRWNGSLWVSSSGGEIVVADFTIPVGIAPPGTMGNNGAVTFSTALPFQFSGAYLYYVANAISSGSAAGFYWTVPSSTTVAVVYNNTYTPGGALTRPASPTAFVTTGPGAYVAPTTEITCYSATMLGGLPGPNGRVTIPLYVTTENSANSKTVRVRANASTILMSNSNTTIPMFYLPTLTWVNRGAKNVNWTSYWAVGGGTTYSGVTTALDTSNDVTITATMQLASNTSTGFFDFLQIKVNPQ